MIQLYTTDIEQIFLLTNVGMGGIQTTVDTQMAQLLIKKASNPE